MLLLNYLKADLEDEGGLGEFEDEPVGEFGNED